MLLGRCATTNPFRPYVYKSLLLGNYVRGPHRRVVHQRWAQGDLSAGATVGGEDAWVCSATSTSTATSHNVPRDPRTGLTSPRQSQKLWESIYLDHIKSFRHGDPAATLALSGSIRSTGCATSIRCSSKRRLRVFDHIVETLGCASSRRSRLLPPQAGILGAVVPLHGGR